VRGGDLSIEETRALCAAMRAPALVLAGDQGAVVGSLDPAIQLAEATGGHLVIAEGCGHPIHGRQPVWFNLQVKEFVDRTTPYHPGKFPARTRWPRAMHRPRRVLYLSSPIGLGHARRDAAIAQALRRPIFPVARNMDTIMVNNFHVFMDVMAARPYDLVVADEGWEVDHFLHEHPELKRAPYVWTTDVVGHLPTAGPDEPFDPAAPRAMDRAYEERMVTDFNLEMISRMERFPGVRDLSIFIGDREDIPPGDRFRPAAAGLDRPGRSRSGAAQSRPASALRRAERSLLEGGEEFVAVGL